MNDVQATQSKNPPPSKGKKSKNKKKNPPDQNNQQMQEEPTTDNEGKRKIRLPYMVCDSLEHYTKDCPRLTEVQQHIKERPNQPSVLTNPFPAQQK